MLIQVAVGLLALMGFSAMVFDLGGLMVARNEAQNLADAGALAGAVARAFDEPGTADPAADGITVESIKSTVNRQYILGEQKHGLTWSWDCPAEPIVPAGVTTCVRVNVFRDGTNSSSRLPVFFAQAFGLADQNTRATATAIAGDATGSNCLKPWLIPDKFNDVNGNGQFDIGTDTYTNPGYTLEDIGTVLLLNPGRPQDAAAPSNFYQVDVNNYYDDIVGCELVKGIGESIDTAPGLSNGLTRNGVKELTKNGPVIVPIGMFSPVQFESNRQTGNFDLTIVNMMGFRLEGMTGNALYGTIVSAPGDIVPGGIGPLTTSSFLKVIQLVQ